VLVSKSDSGTSNVILQSEYGMPDLSTVLGQQRLSPYITDDIDLIILDNLSTLCGGMQENKGDTWREMQEWILRLRARGKSVLMIHHDGKGGMQRGHSKKEDILDTIIQLKRPAQYVPTDGAVFEVHFTKSRGLHGDDVEPFEASLVEFEGNTQWLTKKIEDSTKEKIKKMLDDDFKQKDIAIELDLTEGRISQLKKQIKAEV
jgi:putative DNA primase/helicase